MQAEVQRRASTRLHQTCALLDSDHGGELAMSVCDGDFL
jgi:hypothetical protein